MPLSLGDYKLVIACSNKKRGLANSKYNERRAQCEQSFSDLQQVVTVNSLGELTEKSFAQYESAIRDDICKRRARHAILENQRTYENNIESEAGVTNIYSNQEKCCKLKET